MTRASENRSGSGRGSLDGRSAIDIEFIRSNQHPSGAYPASPTYSQYPYCWLRDGAFTAHAMDLVGERESARAFHQWAAGTILTHRSAAEELIARGRRGEPVLEHEFLPARFSVEGEWLQDGWPNFQLDGYGHWLWSLGEHLRNRQGDGDADIERLLLAAHLVCDYLTTFWQEPCYDAWEEYRSQLHTSTLASIYAGLTAMSDYLPELAKTASEIREVITTECVLNGRFAKHICNPAVDASLLWVSTPFGVVEPHHPLMAATVAEIERTLMVTGGMKRYAADTFYGGGEWVLLTAWLGWHHLRSGRHEQAQECLDWVEATRDSSGALPEQVSCESTNSRFLRYWTDRWGPPAMPLLWSHAMALILRSELNAAQ